MWGPVIFLLTASTILCIISIATLTDLAFL
jgi:hypothetical protein